MDMYIRKSVFNLTHWESWHYHAKYIPISPFWLWYCIKARSFWFFTASNPSITFGGFEGEGKQEIYEQLPENSFPKSLLINHGLAFAEVRQLLKQHEFTYPFIVKPDVGMMGYMFRKIFSDEELQLYHESLPVNYIIQKFVDYDLEVSVFYYRMPNADKGTISGFLMKQQPEVTGDGKSTLATLIEQNKDLKYKQNILKARHQKHLEMVLPENEKYILSYASNRSRGGKLISLAHEIDEKLLNVFDKISLQTKHFYYGRFDIKCASVESLKNGVDFSILEYNGAGAGVQHVYGNSLPLWKACKIIVQHWEVLYRISVYNNKENGVKYWDKKEGKMFLKKARKDIMTLKKMDAEFPVF
jgi:hypothetical protein